MCVMVFQWVYLSMYIRIKMFTTLYLFLQGPYGSCFSYGVYLNVSVTCYAKRGNNVYRTHIREDCCNACTADNQIFSKYILVVEESYPFWFVIKTISTSSENPQSCSTLLEDRTNSNIKRKPSSTSSHSNTTTGCNSLKWTRTTTSYFYHVLLSL